MVFQNKPLLNHQVGLWPIEVPLGLPLQRIGEFRQILPRQAAIVRCVGCGLTLRLGKQLPGARGVSADAARIAFSRFNDGCGQLDQTLEECGRRSGSSGCVP